MPDTWFVPAKTFLVGEYAALKRKSAILLTTSPCFELRTTKQPGLHGIHPHSPAGRWWSEYQTNDAGFSWHDPYQGLGGMGASSAQFLAVYQACAHLHNQLVEPEQLLQDYLQITTTQTGIAPSGYDVLAQQSQGCVYLNRQTNAYEQYAWPFTDLGFILLHTHHKMATHEHLQALVLTKVTDHLSDLVEQAKSAFLTQSSDDLLKVVHAYHQALYEQGWVTEHSLSLIQRLYQETPALAIKGCGAMGSDVLLVLMAQTDVPTQTTLLQQAGWHVLANQRSLYDR